MEPTRKEGSGAAEPKKWNPHGKREVDGTSKCQREGGSRGEEEMSVMEATWDEVKKMARSQPVSGGAGSVN